MHVLINIICILYLYILYTNSNGQFHLIAVIPLLEVE